MDINENIFKDIPPLGNIPKEDFPFALLLLLGAFGMEMNQEHKKKTDK